MSGSIDDSTDKAPIPLGGGDITLESVNIRAALPIGWEAIDALRDLAVELSPNLEYRPALRNLKPPQKAIPFIPMVASVVANMENPDVPAKYPKAEDIRHTYFGVRSLSRVISISSRLSEKFDRYVEGKASDKLDETAERFYGLAQTFEHVEHPREQLTQEVAEIYRHLVSAETDKIDYYGRTINTPSAKIEDFLTSQVRAMKINASINPDPKQWPAGVWFNTQDFPLLTGVLLARRDGLSMYAERAGLAASEILGGIEAYLNHNGINVPPAPKHVSNGFKRSMAETFKPDVLKKVRTNVPGILQGVQDALPEDGPEFAGKVYELVGNVAKLKQAGHSDEVIVEALFAA